MTLPKLRCLIFGHAWVPIDEMPVEPEKARDTLKRQGWVWFCRMCGQFHRRFSE